MKLLTKEIISETPSLYETEEIKLEDKIVTAKFFAGAFTWYMIEYDPNTHTAFGYVENGVVPEFSEWGYFSFSEFEKHNKLKIPLIERDLYFSPAKVKDLGILDNE